jgi:hypothetical protein
VSKLAAFNTESSIDLHVIASTPLNVKSPKQIQEGWVLHKLMEAAHAESPRNPNYHYYHLAQLSEKIGGTAPIHHNVTLKLVNNFPKLVEAWQQAPIHADAEAIWNQSQPINSYDLLRYLCHIEKSKDTPNFSHEYLMKLMAKVDPSVPVTIIRYDQNMRAMIEKWKAWDGTGSPPDDIKTEHPSQISSTPLEKKVLGLIEVNAPTLARKTVAPSVEVIAVDNAPLLNSHSSPPAKDKVMSPSATEATQLNNQVRSPYLEEKSSKIKALAKIPEKTLVASNHLNLTELDIIHRSNATQEMLATRLNTNEISRLQSATIHQIPSTSTSGTADPERWLVSIHLKAGENTYPTGNGRDRKVEYLLPENKIWIVESKKTVVLANQDEWSLFERRHGLSNTPFTEKMEFEVFPSTMKNLAEFTLGLPRNSPERAAFVDLIGAIQTQIVPIKEAMVSTFER